MKPKILFMLIILLISASLYAQGTNHGQVNLATTFEHAISTSNTFNRYTVVLPVAGQLQVHMTRSTLPNNGADVYWFDASNQSIRPADININFPFTEFVDVQAGTYHIEVRGRSGVGWTGNYTIRFDCLVNEQANNTSISNAQLLGFGYTVSGAITTAKNIGVFRYNYTEPGRLNIRLENGNPGFPHDVTNSVRIRWLNSSGTEIRNNTHWFGSGGTSVYSSFMDLESNSTLFTGAGIYYIEVTGLSNRTGNYRLRGDFTPANNNEIELNNTTQTSQLLSSGQTVRGYISLQDNIDVYRYELSEPGRLSVRLENGTPGFPFDVTNSVRIRWLNSSGTEIRNNTHWFGSGGTSVYSSFMDLESNSTLFSGAGTYYLEITGLSSRTGTYRLRGDFTAAGNNEIEPNNSNPLSQILATGQTVKGYISHQDNIDVYRFEHPGGNRTVILHNGAPSFPFDVTNSLRIRWLDINNNEVRNNAHWFGSGGNRIYNQSITSLASGTYFLEISGLSSRTGAYLLTTFVGTAPSVTIDAVSVAPANISMMPGLSQQYIATVIGTNTVASQGVTWSITSGTITTGTSISTSGLLTLASNQVNTTLTIRAQSTVNTARFGTATVTIGNFSVPPGQVTASTPANGATNQPIRPTLTWQQPTSGGTASGYYVYRSTSANPYNASSPTTNRVATVTGSTTTSWTHTTDLASNTTYHWQIVAYNSAGNGTASTSRSFTTSVAPPGQVTASTPANGATNQPIRPTLTWLQPSGTVTGYYVYRGTSANPYNSSNPATNRVATVTGATNLSWTHTSDLAHNTTYHWQIVAYNGSEPHNNGVASTSRSFTTQIALPPIVVVSTPTAGATNQPIRPTLTWQNPGGTISGYYIYRGTSTNPYNSASPETNRIATISSGTTLTWTHTADLAFNTTYHWQVVAYNSAGNGPGSTSRSFTTQTQPPGQVTASTPTAGATNQPIRPTLTWQQPSTGGTVTGYHVYRGTSANPYNSANPTNNRVATVTGATNTSWLHTSDLAYNTTYHWQIVAYNGSEPHNNGVASTSRSFTTLIAPPNPVTLISPDNNATNVILTPTFTWQTGPLTSRGQSQGENDFIIHNEANMTQTGNTRGLSQEAKESSFTDDGLSSEIRDEAGVRTTPTHYTLEISTNSTFTNIIHTSPNINHPTVTYTLPGASALSHNTQYHWRVIATNGTGSSTPNTPRTFTTQLALPGQVTLVTPTNSSINIPVRPTLTWQQPTSGGAVTGYHVYRGTSANPYNSANPESNRVATITGASNTSWVNTTDLEHNTQYHWQVVAYNATGNGQASVSWSFTTLIAIPGQATLVSPLNGTSVSENLHPTFIWQAPTTGGATDGYYVYLSTSANPYNPSNPATNRVATITGASNISWTPTTPLNNQTIYHWQVVAYNTTGNGQASTSWSLNTTVSDSDEVAVIVATELIGNYPNPFNPVTTIKFALVKDENVVIEIYSIKGQKIATLLSSSMRAGEHLITWNGKDDNGNSVVSGIYFYRMQAGEHISIKRMMLLK
jgi:hypothetical protein